MTPQCETLRAGCKVNLSLSITGVRPNGYHTLDSLFWPLPEPFDVLECQCAPEPGIRVLCDTPGIDPARNTLARAYEMFVEATGFAAGLQVTLFKGIPHGAGLGGGSADAAAVLRWCNARAPRPLTPPLLQEVALRVGADVPFFLVNAPCRVQGIGEHIAPCDVPGLRGVHLVLVCPDIQVNTAWAYAAWDQWREANFSTQDLTTHSHRAKHIDSCMTRCRNDFESVVFAAQPALRDIKEALLRGGATAAVMSGSGSSLVGLFRAEGSARTAADRFRKLGMRAYASVL